MAKKSLSGHDFRAPVLLDGSAGSTGQVLTSQGSAGIPIWTAPQLGSSTVVSDTAPTSPNNGDTWFDTTIGTTFIYYDSYWIEIGSNTMGVPGPAGADGAPGVVEATAPLTYNSMTSTIGIDQTAIQPVNNNYIMYLMGAF